MVAITKGLCGRMSTPAQGNIRARRTLELSVRVCVSKMAHNFVRAVLSGLDFHKVTPPRQESLWQPPGECCKPALQNRPVKLFPAGYSVPDGA